MSDSLNDDSLKDRIIQIFNILISKNIDENKSKLTQLIEDKSMNELLTNILQMFEQINDLGDNEKIKLVTSIESKLPPIRDKLIANSSSAIMAYLGSMNISDSLKLKYTRAFVLAMIKLNYNIFYLKMNPKEAYEKAQIDSGIKDKTTFDTLFYVAQPFMISVDIAILGIVTATSPIWGLVEVARKKFTSDSINDPNVTKEEQKNIEKIEKLQKDEEDNYIDFPVALAINDMYELKNKEEAEKIAEMKDKTLKEEKEAKLTEEKKRVEEEVKMKEEEEKIRKEEEKIMSETMLYNFLKLNPYDSIKRHSPAMLQHWGIDRYMSNLILLSILNQLDPSIVLDQSIIEKLNDRIKHPFYLLLNDILINRPLAPIDFSKFLSVQNLPINSEKLSHIMPDDDIVSKPRTGIMSMFSKKTPKIAERKETGDPTYLKQPQSLVLERSSTGLKSNQTLLHKPGKKPQAGAKEDGSTQSGAKEDGPGQAGVRPVLFGKGVPLG